MYHDTMLYKILWPTYLRIGQSKQHLRAMKYSKTANTVNVERFAGLNFRDFQENRESFFVNIYLASYNGVD